MATNSEALAIAIEHHQAGRLEVAEQIYRQILAVDPDQADALHLLGVIASQVGKNEVAVAYISRAIELKGTESAFHSNLGHVFQIQRRLGEAVASYQRALELKPGTPRGLRGTWRRRIERFGNGGVHRLPIEGWSIALVAIQPRD